MIREISVEELSDGRRMSSRDLCKLGCHHCEGCSTCCEDQGTVILLDPYDVFQLTKALQKDFSTLVREGFVRITMVDGLAQPGLNIRPFYGFRERSGKTRPYRFDCCVFLDARGRCRIHDFRPGICRLYPLARLYEGDGFSYILQKDECQQPDGTKIRIRNWLGIPEISRYEDFVLRYHRLLKALQPDEEERKDSAYLQKLNYAFLKLFFMTPYDPEGDFYTDYDARVLSLRLAGGDLTEA